MRFFIAGLLSVAFAHAQSYIYLTFDPAGSSSTSITGINNSDQIIGWFDDALDTHALFPSGAAHILFDAPDALPGRTSPRAINNLSEITGHFNTVTGQHGFIRSVDGRTYTAFDALDLGAGVPTPTGINDLGEVVCIGFQGAGAIRSFLRSPDGSFKITQAQALTTYALGIKNNVGQIVGYFRRGGGLAGINTTGDLAGSCSFGVSFVRKRDGAFIYLQATLI